MAARLKEVARRYLGPRYRRYRRHRDLRFVIYARPRTGSTSLGRAVNDYLGIQCAIEPFSADWGGNVRARVTGLPSLEREIRRLWRLYNGFKHVWEPSGFPFDGQPELNDYVLTAAPDRVVLLNRRNVLRRIVSWHIGDQARVFHLWRDDDRAKLHNHQFQPLDKSAVNEQLARERETFASVSGRLDAVGMPYKVLWYEDVFSAESKERRLAVLGDVISFITGRPFQARLLRPGALSLLDPANPETKLNSAATYELVPGIHEIENEFGCAETGYLFR